MCDKAEAGAYIDAHGILPWMHNSCENLFQTHSHTLDGLDAECENHMHVNSMMKAE